MVHLDGGVADTRRFRFWPVFLCKRGVADSPNRDALTEYMIMLTVAEPAWMDSTPNKRKETNINSGVV